MIQVSVIIVSYNVRELLLQCLRSVYAEPSNQADCEVIVVDNNSSDGSIEAVQANFPQVRCIANKFNAGFSGANNQGIREAKGKYIFLLNPDTEIHGNAIVLLRTYMDANPQTAILAPQLLNTDGSIQVSAWRKHIPWDLVAETFYLHKFHNRLNYPPEQFNKEFHPLALSGAALFFRKSLVTEIGMMNELLFWMEDVELSHRAAQKGELTYLPAAVVTHHSGKSQKKNFNVAISNQLLSKLKFYRLHSGIAGWLLAVIACFIFIVSRLIVFGLLSPFKALFRYKAKAYWYTWGRYFSYVFLNDKRIV